MTAAQDEPKILITSVHRDHGAGCRIDVREPGIVWAKIEDGEVTIVIDANYYSGHSGGWVADDEMRTYRMGRGEGVFYYPDGSVALVLT